MFFLLTILTDITNRTRPFSYYSGVSLDHWMLRFYCYGIFHSWNVLSGLSLVHSMRTFSISKCSIGEDVISIQEHGQLTNDIVLHYHMNACINRYNQSNTPIFLLFGCIVRPLDATPRLWVGNVPTKTGHTLCYNF
jgi:hypothetical protein